LSKHEELISKEKESHSNLSQEMKSQGIKV